MSATKQDVLDSFGWLEHQRILFISAFALGAIGVLTLRLFGIGIIFTSLFALSVMTAYMISGVTKRFIIRHDILGDNLYYLGFLFTLVSMAYSLYSLGVRKSDINAILENFGLAISTTLYGLALRVFFNQSKSDLEGYESAVRVSLTDAAANLIGDLSTIRSNVATLRVSFTQTIDETIAAQKKSLEEMALINKNFINEAINSQSTAISNLIQEVTVKQSKFLKEGSDQQVQNLNKLGQMLTNKQIEMDRRFEKELGAIVFGMSEVLSQLKECVQQFTADAKKFAPATSKVLKELDKFAEHSETINENLVAPLTTMRLVMSNSSERLYEISTSMDSLNQSLNEITTEMPVALNQLNARYSNAIDTQIEFFNMIGANLDDSIKNLINSGNESKYRSEALLANQSQVTQGFADTGRIYQEVITEISTSINSLNFQIIELKSSLANLNVSVKDSAEASAPSTGSVSTN